MEQLVVPSLSVLDIFKGWLRKRGERDAWPAAALMQRGHVVELDVGLALAAAKVRLDHALPLADSVILATARAYDAVLWTQDAHFLGLDGVRYKPKLDKAK